MAPLVARIRELKREKNATILAHTYTGSEIVAGVADYTGDSYMLSKRASETESDVIVFAAVRFMAETAKLLNPKKRVLLPATDGRCSLADSVTAEQVAELRKAHPDHVFVCYINTTAAVKARCDVCVTSGNVFKVVERIPSDKIFFLPDRLMGQNLRNELAKRGVKKE
ncbi:MAG: quinolinate synthase NadA, partial [Fibrobacterales bacterium]|nr:quinolinate synthase NadA [Fibrobacterales bacterium]